MNRIRLAIGFAAFIIAVAVLAAIDVVPQDVARFTQIALPALAVATIGSSRCCHPARARGA